jgi:hypothetical protein
MYELHVRHLLTSYNNIIGRQWEKLFREYIPKEAIRSDYLMSAMLALTSFHIASEAIDNDPALTRRHVHSGFVTSLYELHVRHY